MKQNHNRVALVTERTKASGSRSPEGSKMDQPKGSFPALAASVGKNLMSYIQNRNRTTLNYKQKEIEPWSTS
jgi:hypothetical protein